jgi:hypothetical protein
MVLRINILAILCIGTLCQQNFYDKIIEKILMDNVVVNEPLIPKSFVKKSMFIIILLIIMIFMNPLSITHFLKN